MIKGARPIDMKTDDHINRKNVLQMLGLQKQSPFDYSHSSTASDRHHVDEATKENSSC